MPLVKGRVLDVPVKAQPAGQEGDVLFRIDAEPFQEKVASLTARLASNTDFLRKALDARLRSASLDRDRALELMRRGIGKQRDLDVTQANVDDIVAQIDQQKASLNDPEAQLNIAKYRSGADRGLRPE